MIQIFLIEELTSLLFHFTCYGISFLNHYKRQIGIISLSCVVWLRNFNHNVAWHLLNTFAFVKYAIIHNIPSVHW